MFHILVVEDDPKLRQLICALLEKNNYKAFEAANGKEALQIIEKQYIDLMISDVMMPQMNGYELSRMLREANYKLPILLVTAKDSFEDKKEGFLSGIDDYMVKPIHLEEMMLRINSLLRRAQIVAEHKMVVGKTIFEYDQLSVTTDQDKKVLPQKEFYLIYKLLSYPNKIFTRQQLMDEIWGMETESDERTVDVHINRLRERFKENKDFAIKTIRGLGYKAVKKEYEKT